ncbi:hypothetical protein SAMN04487935_1104 [Flavobacterium noncentrifugens]|uniref:Uncharacterized protein n=1 Tax=Flavobacterium noncentrifugens TaxID=1128970 RepID=A0A1G8V0E9_9FLAO|nr:hypothetical protein SAMN04487935_1104 [Flavobacterium noncentrifugens]
MLRRIDHAKHPYHWVTVPSGTVISIRILPFGRRSNSQTGFVKPFGPHHCASSFSSVKHLKTNSHGALKIRSMRTSLTGTSIRSMIKFLFFQALCPKPQTSYRNILRPYPTRSKVSLLRFLRSGNIFRMRL